MNTISVVLCSISILMNSYAFSGQITFYNDPGNGNDLWLFLPLTGEKCTTQSTKVPLGSSATIENMLSECELKRIAVAINEPKNKEKDTDYPITINLYGQEIIIKPSQKASQSFVIQKKQSNTYTLRPGSLTSQ